MATKCHKETFTNGSFMAINLMVLDDEHRFCFGHKKGPHLHVRLFVFWIIVSASKSLNRSIVRSRRLHEQGVD